MMRTCTYSLPEVSGVITGSSSVIYLFDKYLRAYYLGTVIYTRDPAIKEGIVRVVSGTT
jgi:hypothetical protein